MVSAKELEKAESDAPAAHMAGRVHPAGSASSRDMRTEPHQTAPFGTEIPEIVPKCILGVFAEIAPGSNPAERVALSVDPTEVQLYLALGWQLLDGGYVLAVQMRPPECFWGSA